MQNKQLPDQLYDIYDIIYQPFWRSRWFFWICVIIAVLIFLLGILLFVRWWRSRIVKRDYWHQALYDLDRLPTLVHHHGVPEKIYTQLTEIMKVYFSSRYALTMRGCTDDELIAHLEKILSSEQIQVLRTVIPRAVEIKFAGQESARQIMLDDIGQVRVLIEQTRSVESSEKK